MRTCERCTFNGTHFEWIPIRCTRVSEAEPDKKNLLLKLII